jgi:hypothetical protein
VAAFVTVAGAATLSPTGDTCTASGNGTDYTLNITLPSNAPQQGGFAFGAPGVTVTSIDSSTQGSFSTTNLSPNTTGEWLLANPAVVGASVVASITTSGPVTGSFTVVAANSPPSAVSYSPFVCEVSAGTPQPNTAFTTAPRATYDSVTRVWHELVGIPGPGTVSFVQQISANQSMMPKRLIEGGKVSAKSAGSFALTLRATGDGAKMLKASGSIKLKLGITFSPSNGRSATKIVNLTLRK